MTRQKRPVGSRMGELQRDVYIGIHLDGNETGCPVFLHPMKSCRAEASRARHKRDKSNTEEATR